MEDYSIHSPYWAFNQKGWKPCCARCRQRRVDCKKYNSDELGQFAGEWVCTDCLRDADYKTPCQLVLDRDDRVLAELRKIDGPISPRCAVCGALRRECTCWEDA